MGQNVELEFDGKNKQRYGWKHLSIEKSDFCSLCLAMHCSKFPPQVPVETYRTEKKNIGEPSTLGEKLESGSGGKNKQTDGWKHLSNEKSDFFSTCMAIYC